ncbi:MAG: GntR family transcriptional regulator [Casimicrobium sp.]
MIPVQDLVPAKSLVEQVYREIRNRILENIWTPGYQALEQEIAQMLGVSRTPVREALIRLEKESFVKVVPRHGMRVLPVSPEDMKDIYEVLTALECFAAERLANRRPTAKELQPLIDATKRMSEALERDDLDAWAKADETFHWALVSLSGNKLLLETVMGYWDRAHRARLFTLRLRPKPVNSTKEHMQLVERLAAGDAAGAIKVNREHRERASRELVVIFERYRLQQL